MVEENSFERVIRCTVWAMFADRLPRTIRRVYRRLELNLPAGGAVQSGNERKEDDLGLLTQQSRSSSPLQLPGASQRHRGGGTSQSQESVGRETVQGKSQDGRAAVETEPGRPLLLHTLRRSHTIDVMTSGNRQHPSPHATDSTTRPSLAVITNNAMSRSQSLGLQSPTGSEHSMGRGTGAASGLNIQSTEFRSRRQPPAQPHSQHTPRSAHVAQGLPADGPNTGPQPTPSGNSDAPLSLARSGSILSAHSRSGAGAAALSRSESLGRLANTTTSNRAANRSTDLLAQDMLRQPAANRSRFALAGTEWLDWQVPVAVTRRKVKSRSVAGAGSKSRREASKAKRATQGDKNSPSSHKRSRSVSQEEAAPRSSRQKQDETVDDNVAVTRVDQGGSTTASQDSALGEEGDGVTDRPAEPATNSADGADGGLGPNDQAAGGLPASPLVDADVTDIPAAEENSVKCPVKRKRGSKSKSIGVHSVSPRAKAQRRRAEAAIRKATRAQRAQPQAAALTPDRRKKQLASLRARRKALKGKPRTTQSSTTDSTSVAEVAQTTVTATESFERGGGASQAAEGKGGALARSLSSAVASAALTASTTVAFGLPTAKQPTGASSRQTAVTGTPLRSGRSLPGGSDVIHSTPLKGANGLFSPAETHALRRSPRLRQRLQGQSHKLQFSTASASTTFDHCSDDSDGGGLVLGGLGRSASNTQPPRSPAGDSTGSPYHTRSQRTQQERLPSAPLGLVSPPKPVRVTPPSQSATRTANSTASALTPGGRGRRLFAHP